ncbi:hypothetical protein [Azospirillum sp. sgz302134]
MSLLTIIQDAADLIGLPRPAVVVSSADTTVRQMLAHANAEGRALAARWPWTVLQKEAVVTVQAQEDQGALETLMPGFGHVLNRTEWDRSKRWPLGGPVSPQHWQQLKSVTALGPFYSFRIVGGRLKLIPAPKQAGEVMALEYVSRFWCQSAGGAGQDRWAADTDTGVLDEWLMTLGLVWRFKQSRGLDYGEDMASYERQAADAMGRDGGRRTLDLGQSEGERFPPRVSAPEGSWSL